MRRSNGWMLGLGLCLVMPSRAWAAGADRGKAEDAASNQARELHERGDKLYRQQDFAEAWAAYSAAWSLKKHWQIAGNLGDCEVQLGKYRDAAEHLAIFLRADPSLQSPEDRKNAIELQKEALRHVGTIVVDVSHAGAEVFVQGVFIGISPISEELYVEPGRRLVDARLGTAVGYAYVDAREGQKTQVKVSLTQPGAVGGASPIVVRPVWPVYLAGGSLTAAGLVTGVVFWLEANRRLEERRSLVNGVTYTTCNDPAPPECSGVNEEVDAAIRDRWISRGSFIAAGVSAVFTLSYAIAARNAAVPKKADAWLYVMPGSAGVGVTGRF